MEVKSIPSDNAFFNQRVQYAVITTFRNYSNIGQKSTTTNSLDLWCSLKDEHVVHSLPPKTMNRPFNRGKKLSQIFYYTDTVGVEIPIPKAPFGGVFVTQDQQKITKHMSNPFSQVELYIRENRIEKKDGVVKMVCDIYKKQKNFNTKWSKKTVHKIVIKIDFNKGNFLIMTQRGRFKKFGTNTFHALNEIPFRLFSDFDMIRQHPNTELVRSLKMLTSFKLFSNVFIKVCKNMIEFGDSDDFEKTINKILLENLIKNKKIKVPNDYKLLLTNFYPTQKYLKKNDNKLVQSCLDMLGIKTPTTSKILHENSFNIMYLVRLREILGKDFNRYLRNIRWDLINYLGSSLMNVKGSICHTSSINKHNISLDKEKPFFETKKEKGNVVRIINDYLIKRSDESKNRKLQILYLPEATGFVPALFLDLADHKKMMVDIVNSGQDVQLNATTYKTFMEEHANYGDIQRRIKRLYTIQRHHNEDILQQFNHDYFDGEDTFKIKVLSNQDDFYYEGKSMSHCVVGYIRDNNSFIVSVKDKNGDGAVTIEYSVTTGGLLQCRERFNKPPQPYMSKVINYVSNFVEVIGVEGRKFKIIYLDKYGISHDKVTDIEG